MDRHPSLAGLAGLGLLGLCLLLPAPWVRGAEEDALAAGDAAWSRRAVGHQGIHAGTGPIDEAIAAYERAARAQPDRLEVTWKLLRAVHFKGEFVARSAAEKRAIFGRGRDLAEAGLDRLAQR
ncbi:MAG: hypothetical protein M3O15_00315, partial [Acidobacteriota bacterium]|nr:hypothetical protein [Acidobacteriota bacterium]